MKTEKLLNEIGQIDDSIIVEAETKTLKIRRAKRTWLRWTSAAAACVAVFVGIVAIYNHNTAPIESDFPELPMLTVNMDSGDFGFEGYMAYDINELQSGNPWSESDELKTLPVFQNPTSYDSAGQPINGISADEMIEKAKETALALGLTVDSIYTNPTEEDLRKEQEKAQAAADNEGYEADATPYEAIAVCGDITIKIEANGAARIFFEKGVQLPDKYSFTYHDTDEQQAKAVIQYLLEQYEPIVAMTSPALDLFGDYNIYEQRSFSFDAYENSGNLTDRILGYNFNRVSFSPNDDGALWIIDRYSTDLSQKMGDYPIITAQEARELLLQKHYITTVPEELPDAKYIASVELIYRTGRHDEVFMPYYRFLVELPTMQSDNGLKTFGAFYVPAVDERYLSNMPLWDGGFN